MRAADLTGQRFGLLTAVSRSDKGPGAHFNCVCDCGQSKVVSSINLKFGRVQSCGCLRHRSRAHDLTGQVFGRLTVLGRAENQRPGRAMWTCECSCGNTTVVPAPHLTKGETKSCGCLQRTHGESKTRTYHIWKVMRQRCRDPKATGYQHYGGRGISVCQRWQDYSAFIQDLGQAPDGLTIDRINNDGDYEPGNCRWVSRKVQGNNKSNNHRLAFGGVTKTLSEWADSLSINAATLYTRLKASDFNLGLALAKPINSRRAS